MISGLTNTLNVSKMEGRPNRRMQVIKNKKLYTDSAADWRWNPVRGFFFVNSMIAPILTEKCLRIDFKD